MRGDTPVKSFAESGDAERFLISGRNGNRIDYLARRADEVWLWSTSLGDVGLDQLSREYRNAREIVEKSMKIAAEICIYSNENVTIEELKAE